MFVTRLISGIVLVAVALLTICSGGWILYGILTIVSLIGMFELYRAVKVQKQGENLLAVVGYLGVFLSEISCRTGDGSLFRCGLCGCHAVLHLSDQDDPRRSISCMADLSVFLGL